MKTEKEIRVMVSSIKNLDKDLVAMGLIESTERGGHWIDVLEWVLQDEEARK